MAYEVAENEEVIGVYGAFHDEDSPYYPSFKSLGFLVKVAEPIEPGLTYQRRTSCSFCGVLDGDIIHKFCGRCKARFYCSVECQRNDWFSKHKHHCPKLLEAIDWMKQHHERSKVILRAQEDGRRKADFA